MSETKALSSYTKLWSVADSNETVGSITATADGGYVIVGRINSDAFLAKFSSNGELVWDKTWGGSGDDWANSITTTTDGGYVIAGQTGSFGAGSYDAFLAKFSSNGELVWDKTWGGDGFDMVNAIAATNDGGCVLTGYTFNFGDGSGDAFIAKFTSNGELVWDKTWGGDGWDYATSIASASDNGFVITGPTGSFSSGYADIFIAKFSSEGDITWNEVWARKIIQIGLKVLFHIQ